MKNTKCNLHRYCLALLRRYDCPRDAYRGMAYIEALDGIREEHLKPTNKFGESSFSDEQIARELVDIGDSEPEPRRAKYHLIWDDENCTDGFDCGNNKRALRGIMRDFLIEWILQFGDQDDTSVDAWDSMIYNCGCACYRNADLTPGVELDRIWSLHLSAKELKKMGWCLVEEMSDEQYAVASEAYGWNRERSFK